MDERKFIVPEQLLVDVINYIKDQTVTLPYTFKVPELIVKQLSALPLHEKPPIVMDESKE